MRCKMSNSVEEEEEKHNDYRWLYTNENTIMKIIIHFHHQIPLNPTRWTFYFFFIF